METLVESGVACIDKKDILEYDKQSIGILVFESLGDDYYGYGLTNDLINDFDRVNKVYVADIQDVLRYKSSELAMVDIARKLQVDNILDGVCRIEDDRIFLSIRMLDITTGKTLWKEELSEPLININLLKANIIKKVLEILNVQVPVFILNKMLIGMTNDPVAYELYHQGLYKIEVIRNKDEYPQARKLFQQALEKDQNFVESLAQYAITSNKMGFFEEAEEMIDKALDKADEKNNDLGKAKALDSMGIIYQAWKKYKKATACFEKALKIQVKYEDQLAEAKTLTNLSACYINLQDPDKGIEVLIRSIYLKEKLDKDNLLATSYGQLGSAYRNKFHYDNAINNFRKAMGKFTRQNNEYYAGRVMVLLARCYCDIGDSIKALDYLENAENICINFGEPHILGRIKWIRGRILRSKNEYKKAIAQFEQSIAYFKEGGLRKPTIESLMEIMIIQIASGQIDSLPKLTSEYSKIAEKVSDSDKHLGFLDCIYYLLNVHNGTTENINLNDIEIFLEKLFLSEEKYIGWWILYIAAGMEKNNDRKRNYHSKAIKIIYQLADTIGNDTYKELFLKKYPIIDIIKY
jgi:tetratricopeptide (TPR) repeat protein